MSVHFNLHYPRVASQKALPLFATPDPSFMPEAAACELKMV
jgi:hypothetical protein